MTDEVIDALAVFRLTRVLTTDTFPPVQHLRWKVAKRWPEGDWRTELASCPWCLSFWVGLGVLVVRRTWVWRRFLGPSLAASAVAGLLAEMEP